jgi:5-methylcytosine-specific restriction endonuclease McrA
MLNKHSIPLNVRLYVIKRDKNTCQYCGKKGIFIFRYDKPTVVENPNHIELEEGVNFNGSGVIPFEIDHILARFNGGNNNPDNLALSCRKCNKRKGWKNGQKKND